jgi:putative ATPase
VFPAGTLPTPEEAERLFATSVFDHIFAREPWRKGADAAAFRLFAEAARQLIAPQGNIVILQSPPALGERISRILRDECGAALPTPVTPPLVAKLEEAESAFFAGQADPRLSWDQATLETCFAEAGFNTSLRVLEQKEERLISTRDLNAWFDPQRSSWGAFIAGALGEERFLEAKALLAERIRQGPLVWRWKSLLLKVFC